MYFIHFSCKEHSVIHSFIQQKAWDIHYASATMQGAGIVKSVDAHNDTLQSEKVFWERHTQGTLEIFLSLDQLWLLFHEETNVGQRYTLFYVTRDS